MSLLKQKYSFIIFDWDGTLMDSTARIVSAMQATAREAKLVEPSEKLVKSIIGLSMQAVMDKLFPQADEKLRQELFEIYRYQYVEGDPTPSPLFTEAKSLLNWLKEKGIVVAIATGKARAGLDRVLNEVGLLDFFDYSICADEAQSKPHPEMITSLLNQSGISASETLIIGDSVHDLKMANNATVDCVGVTSGANNFTELAEFQPVVTLERVCYLQSWLEQN